MPSHPSSHPKQPRSFDIPEERRHIFDAPPPGSQITRVKPTKRDPTRIGIEVNGTYACAVDAGVAYELELRKGLPWTPALAANIRHQAVYGRALRFCVNSLSKKLQSTGEIQQKLRKREVPQDVLDRVIARAQEAGLLDDGALAQSIIRNQLARKPAGAQFLQLKLSQRHLDRQLAQTAIAQALSQRDEHADAMELASSKARKIPPSVDKQAALRRIVGTLARRGFSPGVAYPVARVALENHTNKNENKQENDENTENRLDAQHT